MLFYIYHLVYFFLFIFFFFQAEDGIRDKLVTGVQTCALPILHIVFAVAWRPGALDLVSLRAGVRLGGGEVASRRAAPAAAARHPAEHSGARLSPRARARLDVAVPDPQRGARARGHPDDLHGAGVEPRALLLQLPQGARSEEHTSELQSLAYLVCRLLLEKKKKKTTIDIV